MDEEILQQLGQGNAPSPTVPGEETESTDIKYDKEKKKSKVPLDDEVIRSMMANGDNSKGMFEPDEKSVKEDDEDLHAKQDDEVKLKTKGDAKPSKKYESKFAEDVTKNPENYFVNTPKGKMSVKEAQEKGYDPVTHRFNRKRQSEKKVQELMSQLNDKDRAGIERMMDPSQVGLAPADAQALGLKPDSKMIRRDGEQQQAVPQQQPAMQPQYNTQQQTPAAPQQQGQPDIASLLGGVQ